MLTRTRQQSVHFRQKLRGCLAVPSRSEMVRISFPKSGDSESAGIWLPFPEKFLRGTCLAENQATHRSSPPAYPIRLRPSQSASASMRMRPGPRAKFLCADFIFHMAAIQIGGCGRRENESDKSWRREPVESGLLFSDRPARNWLKEKVRRVARGIITCAHRARPVRSLRARARTRPLPPRGIGTSRPRSVWRSRVEGIRFQKRGARSPSLSSVSSSRSESLTFSKYEPRCRVEMLQLPQRPAAGRGGIRQNERGPARARKSSLLRPPRSTRPVPPAPASARRAVAFRAPCVFPIRVSAARAKYRHTKLCGHSIQP